MRSAAKTFDLLGNEITLELFRHITGQGSKPTTTRKQYYSRMDQLRKMGLIEKVAQGQYAITNLGKIMEYIINTTELALDNRGQLSTLDALQLANRRNKIKDVTPEQWDDLLRNIIKDKTIKNIIFDTKREPTN